MIDLNKVLITGCEGRIGKEIEFGIKLNRQELDVTNEELIREALKKYEPSAVLNLASIDLRECQTKPFLANQVNVIGTYNLASETNKVGIPLIIVSSGAIFNGNKEESFDEQALPNPQNIYGQTKYLSEIIARKCNPATMIIRTGWLFGFKKSENFFNALLNNAKIGNEIKATGDQYGSFTYIEDFIQGLKKMISVGESGTYHLVNADRGTAIDMAKIIISKSKSKSRLVETSIDNNETSIKRSKSEVLESSIKLRSWKKALEDYYAKNS